jgi:hypothetical protein
MKILYLLKQDPGETLKAFISVHQNSHDVSVIDIRENKNYSQLVQMVEECDKIISW